MNNWHVRLHGGGQIWHDASSHASLTPCVPPLLDLDSHSSHHTQPPAVPFFFFRPLLPHYIIAEEGGEMAACNQGNISSQGEEVLLEKRYGGIASKKPLISKDHERAYFDSADWVLGKQQGTSPKSNTAAVESLKPKLKRTPHHQLPPRRPTCTTGVEDSDQ